MDKIWRYIRLNIPTFGSSIVIALLVGVYSIISFFNIVFLPERYDILMIPALSFLLLVLMFIVIDTYENLKKTQHIIYYSGRDASLKVVGDIVTEALCKSESEQTNVDILVANLEYSNPGNGKIQDYEKKIISAINDPKGKYKIYYKYLIAKCPQKKEQMFTLKPEYRRYLNEGAIADELRNVFKEQNWPLASNTHISNQDKEWTVQIDGENKYHIKDTGKELNIYKKGWCRLVEEEIANKLPSGKFELRYTKIDISFPMFNMLIVPQLKKVYIGLGNDPTFYQGGILITGGEMEDFASQFECYFNALFKEKYSYSYNQPESENGRSHL